MAMFVHVNGVPSSAVSHDRDDHLGIRCGNGVLTFQHAVNN